MDHTKGSRSILNTGALKTMRWLSSSSAGLLRLRRQISGAEN